MNPRSSEIRIGAIVFHLSIGLLISIAGAQAPPPQSPDPRTFLDPDSDGDGLSDFHEIHKYLTDPHRKDSGDEWMARREHAYTIRSVVRVMRPVDVAAMNDDFQDARLRRETEEFVEVEVIHYPFGTANQAIAGNPRWREDAARMKEWLEPGLTANWDEPMRKDVAALVGDLAGLDDKQVVEKVVPILLSHARQDEKGFTTFFTALEGGKPSIPAEIRGAVEKECAGFGRTIEEQWAATSSPRACSRRRPAEAAPRPRST